MDRFLRERGETFFILVISWIIQGRLINIVEKWGKEEGRAGISLFLVVAYVRESNRASNYILERRDRSWDIE